MMKTSQPAYSNRQWFWSVNLIGVLAATGIFLLGATTSFMHHLALLPYYLVVSLAIAWIFVAYPLAIAMQKPAGYIRAAMWGAAMAMLVAFVGFCIARLLANGQIGAGDAMQMQNGVLTRYGWQRVFQRNLIFVGYGVAIALIVRAIVGPGRKPS